MAAFRIIRRLRDLYDFTLGTPSDGDRVTYDAATGGFVLEAPFASGAPADANYLVGTAHSDLSAEIVVGTAPGGELGGTWAAPTVDASHAGSSHAAVQAAAEATAAAGLLAHTSDATDAHAATAITNTPAGNIAATTAQAAINELDSEKAALSHAHSGADITSGTVVDARIDAAIARDSEVTSAISALSSVYQPLDSDLTAVAALTTTSYGRAFLALADAAAAQTALGVSTFIKTLLDDADAATARATLGSTSAPIKSYTSLSNSWIAQGNVQAAATQGYGSVNCQAGPLFLPKTTTFKAIGIRVTTGGASSFVRIGIHNDNGNLYPGTLFQDFGTVDCSATGAKTITSTFTLTAGTWWPCVQWEGPTNAVTIACLQGTELWPVPWTAFPTTSVAFNWPCWVSASSSGSLPNPFSATVVQPATPAPLVGLQVT